MNLGKLEEVSRIATQETSAALSKMLKTSVTVVAHSVKGLSVDALFQEINQAEVNVVISAPVVGDLEGNLSLLFSKESALHVADLLLKKESKTVLGDYTAEQRTALEELANVLAGNYLRAFSKELGAKSVLHRAGFFYSGTLDSMRAHIFSSLAQVPSEGNLVGILFTCEEQRMKGHVVILLSSERLEKVGGAS